jgi:ABC-2 type transport system permease protein
MHEFGFLDFATLLALLTPLVIIALTYGLVQEDRESGVWRLVCTQTAKPWRLVYTALGVRYGLLLTVMIISSLLTFALDSGATGSAIGQWLLFISLYALVWFGIAGLFLLLPISSGAAAIAMLGTWLVITFAIPAGLGWAANQYAKMPSRMTAIIEIRHFQELNNQQRQEATTQWYANHPDIKLPTAELPRDIAGLPAALKLDSQIRPLMYQFDAVRKSQFEFMERWSAASPALAVILMADRLAGIDAPRYADFIHQVNQFEDQWRDFFVPNIMADNAWTQEQQQTAPTFSVDTLNKPITCWYLSLIQLITAIVLFSVLFLLRRRFAKT